MKPRLETPNRRMYPELGRFDADDRKKALQRATKYTPGGPFGGRFGLVMFVGEILGVTLAFPILLRLLGRFEPTANLPLPIATLIAVGAPVGCFTLLYIWLLRTRVRKSLRRLLLEDGIPICLKCGYDIRGLSTPRCPECGEEFDPALLSEDESAGKI